MSSIDYQPEKSSLPTGKEKQAPLYDDFGLGFKIYKRRIYLKRKKGVSGNKTTEDAAKALGIDVDDYIGIERRKSGLRSDVGVRIREILNDIDKIEKLAIFLEMDSDRLHQWIMSAQDSIERKLKYSVGHDFEPIESALLLNSWGSVKKEFTEAYCKRFNKNEIDSDIKTVLNNVEKYSKRITKVPFLPQPLFIMLNAILGPKDPAVGLDKINVFTGEDENMCDFLEFCPNYSSAFLYASNKLFDSDNPKRNLRDCFKPMSKERLSILLYVMIHKIGIYEFNEDLKPLQKFHEFHTLGMRMAELLKPHLSENISYDVLQNGLAMQGIGTYILYVILCPSLKKEESSRVGHFNKKYLYYNLNNAELDLINYYYHPIVSAQLATNWGYDETVVKLLLDHHNNDYKDISPECACLKLINRLVDQDFRIKDRDDIDIMLSDFEQLTINREDLFNIVCKMDRLKDELIKASSSLIDTRSKQAAEAKKERIKTFTDRETELRHGGIIKIFPGAINEDSVRFEPEYLLALKNECHLMLNLLHESVTSKRENEAYEKFTNRMLLLQLALDVVMSNHEVVAQRMGITVEDLKRKLQKIG
ncbi:MAG: hypothetical protein HQM16_13640 [Deltaproteobacteria bacterium]|nr:hypothetical protein [Deltaproteobacteria bacterium]